MRRLTYLFGGIVRHVQVKLMRQLRDEAQKSRQAEQKSRKTIAQLQKQQQAKESKIRNLESEKNKKELILKRKMEEVVYARHFKLHFLWYYCYNNIL